MRVRPRSTWRRPCDAGLGGGQRGGVDAVAGSVQTAWTAGGPPSPSTGSRAPPGPRPRGEVTAARLVGQPEQRGRGRAPTRWSRPGRRATGPTPARSKPSATRGVRLPEGQRGARRSEVGTGALRYCDRPGGPGGCSRGPARPGSCRRRIVERAEAVPSAGWCCAASAISRSRGDRQSKSSRWPAGSGRRRGRRRGVAIRLDDVGLDGLDRTSWSYSRRRGPGRRPPSGTPAPHASAEEGRRTSAVRERSSRPRRPARPAEIETSRRPGGLDNRAGGERARAGKGRVRGHRRCRAPTAVRRALTGRRLGGRGLPTGVVSTRGLRDPGAQCDRDLGRGCPVLVGRGIGVAARPSSSGSSSKSRATRRRSSSTVGASTSRAGARRRPIAASRALRRSGRCRSRSPRGVRPSTSRNRSTASGSSS